ncbi:MAG: ABC transporter substrate-binding protein [Pseudomonadota bacterium]
MARIALWISILIAFASAAMAQEVVIKTAVLRVEQGKPLPLTRIERDPADIGFAGAAVGLDDNNTTGRFLKHNYEAVEIDTTPDQAVSAAEAAVADGASVLLVMADADTVLALADRFAGQNVLVMNAEATDDRLRQADCRANVLHIAPSRAMLTDGLAQYMVWKQWTDWFLIRGSHSEDGLKAEAYRRSARKFGARIVEERVFEDTGGARRSDSGHVQVQRQMPVFTQRAEDHHVVVAADENAVFAAYLPYRTWEARPVVGDAGLITRNWHPAHEGFGGTQMQTRFEKKADRPMRDLDYQAWTAMRVLGEAVTRAQTADIAALKAFILSPDFKLAAFKGQPLNFRPWNNQLRQGIVLADGRTVVSISPQDEFLHKNTRLDTLGVDEPESECTFP